MDKDELALLQGVEKRFNEFCEELPNLGYNEQKQAIKAFKRKMIAWEQRAMSLGMFLLMKAIEEKELPEVTDYENIELIQQYIESHPKGIDFMEAAEFFNDLCWRRHGTAFNAETCLRGHLSELGEYYQKKREQEEKKAREEQAARKRAHLINAFFGDE